MTQHLLNCPFQLTLGGKYIISPLIEKRKTLWRPNFFRSSWYKAFVERSDLYNRYASYHTEAFNAWQNDQAFSTLSTETQRAISESINQVINYKFASYRDYPPESTET